MSIFSNKFSNTFLISLTIILGLIIGLLLFLGLVVEKKNLSINAELNGQRIVLSIPDETIISRPAIVTARKSDYNQIDSEISLQRKPIELSGEKPITPKDDEEKVVNNNSISTNINNAQTEEVETLKTQQPIRVQGNSEKELMEDKRPSIAIVIGGLGLSKSSTTSAIKLPANVTLGFSPYSYDIDKLSYEALELGHEVLINLPLEPMEYPADDPGPNALISELSDEENMQRLKFILSQIKAGKGVYSIDDEKFTRSLTGTRVLLTTLRKSDKLFLYGVGAKNTVLQQIAERLGYPLLINDVIIDQIISTQAINENLLKLEEIAKKNGMAIGIGNPYPVTIEALEEWANSLDNKGIKLVPVSIFYKILLKKLYGNSTISNNENEKSE